jgi:hypothetical protein
MTEDERAALLKELQEVRAKHHPRFATLETTVRARPDFDELQAGVFVCSTINALDDEAEDIMRAANPGADMVQ